MSTPQWYNGHRLGCLPRRTKPGEKCPLFSSRIKETIPEGEWDALSQEISLEPKVREVLNQKSVGSCASESKDGAEAIGLAVAGVPHVSFNPYGTYHFVNNGRDQGSTLDDNLEFGRDKGCFPESVWPRSKGWQPRPDDAAMEAAARYRIVEYYDILTIPEFVTALLLGIPVTYGAKGHAVTAVRHTRNAPIIVNSWGESWENNGFGVWATYREIESSLQYGAYAVRTVSTDHRLFQEPVA